MVCWIVTSRKDSLIYWADTRRYLLSSPWFFFWYNFALKTVKMELSPHKKTKKFFPLHFFFFLRAFFTPPRLMLCPFSFCGPVTIPSSVMKPCVFYRTECNGETTTKLRADPAVSVHTYKSLRSQGRGKNIFCGTITKTMWDNFYILKKYIVLYLLT